VDNFLPNFWQIAGAILLACFAAWLSYRTAYRERRANACLTFRTAVLNELGSIYPNPAVWPRDVDAFLRSHFTALQIAVENFRPFVPWWNRWRFDRAWFRYRCATGRKVDIQCYLHYFDAYDSRTETQSQATARVKDLFHSNVSKLLSFANET